VREGVGDEYDRKSWEDLAELSFDFVAWRPKRWRGDRSAQKHFFLFLAEAGARSSCQRSTTLGQPTLNPGFASLDDYSLFTHGRKAREFNRNRPREYRDKDWYDSREDR
jgi:hypothetical protein